MRDCTFKIWIRKTGYTQPIDGKFHGFGKKIHECETGLAEETIAIVEDEQGTLHRVNVETITFKKE